MTKNLSKVQKRITKKRGGKIEALHENSRDSQRLRRAGAREDKLARFASEMHKGRRSYVDRVAFFQDAVKDAAGPLSEADMAELIKKYIERNSSELEQLKQEHRKGRPPVKREELLLEKMEQENREFNTGFWIPDLTKEITLTKLKLWSGDWSGLSTLSYVRAMRDGVKRESSFPPKGMS